MLIKPKVQTVKITEWLISLTILSIGLQITIPTGLMIPALAMITPYKILLPLLLFFSLFVVSYNLSRLTAIGRLGLVLALFIISQLISILANYEVQLSLNLQQWLKLISGYGLFMAVVITAKSAKELERFTHLFAFVGFIIALFAFLERSGLPQLDAVFELFRPQVLVAGNETGVPPPLHMTIVNQRKVAGSVFFGSIVMSLTIPWIICQYISAVRRSKHAVAVFWFIVTGLVSQAVIWGYSRSTLLGLVVEIVVFLLAYILILSKEGSWANFLSILKEVAPVLLVVILVLFNWGADPIIQGRLSPQTGDPEVIAQQMTKKEPSIKQPEVIDQQIVREEPSPSRRFSYAAVGAAQTMSHRWALILVGVRIFYDHPLFGVGFANFRHQIVSEPRYAELVPFVSEGKEPRVGDAHNLPVQIAATSGLVGIIAFLGVIVVILWELARLWAAPRPKEQVLIGFGVFSSLAGIAVQSMTGYSLVDMPLVLSLGLILAVLQVLSNSTKSIKVFRTVVVD